MTITSKRKPKPLELGMPPAIPPPPQTIPPTRPEGELDALAANFQYLSDRVADVATRGDLPSNAHEFITKTQTAINNIAAYTRKVKQRDLNEYRTTLANHRVDIVLKVAAIAVLTLFCGFLFNSSNNQPVYVYPNQNLVQPGDPNGVPHADGIHPP
jgi:hypothetical protein